MRFPRPGLVPRDDSFVALFASIADDVARGAVVLADVMAAAPDDRAQRVETLGEVERSADDAVHLVVRRLGATFAPPFDRRDVYALAHQLDDCLDRLNAAGQLVVLHRLTRVPTPCFEVVQCLQRQAELTSGAVRRLRETKELAEYWVEVHRLQNQVASLHRRLRAELLDEAEDLRRSLRLRDVLDELAAAASAFERVAETIETIALVEP